MEKLLLNAQERTITGKKVKIIRTQGKIPAVLYGHGVDSTNLSLDKSEFTKLFKQSGISTLVHLKIGDAKPINVLIHEPQLYATTHSPIHVDFYQVKMSEKIRTEIPIHFTGISPAVDDLEGNLITNKDAVEVECLPDALVTSIEVDISTLKNFEDVIHTSDIKIPEGITVLSDLDETIALVTAPRSEEELEEELAESTVEEEKAQIAEMEEPIEGEEPEEDSKEKE